MKSLSRLLTIVVMALSGMTASAQSYPNGLSTDSVDPEADKAFIDIMRSRMEKIHVEEGRPTVALVLSGGGAKGSAHVGVLKVLEELEIPVDMICGTSMGGLVGGLYAMGYPASKLDSLLRAQDWDVTLTDKVAPYYISYATKDYQSKYLFAIPFHYEKPAVKTKKQGKEVRYRNRRNDLNLDADAGDFNTQAGVNTLASSLPSGYVYGFNVNNLISSLTVGYQDDISFTDLPIPYFAVASDMVSCKAKYWGDGSVKSAIRSTMSIPGMFDPVWTDDLVLVDGGTRNNFPVDLARTMGADYVIGVDLSTIAPDYSEVNNLGNILMQFIKMLGQDAFDKNKPEVDVFIKPDLDGYNMLSFNPVAIDTMINRGYMAAKTHMQELMDIKYMMNGAHPRLNSHPAVDISERPVNLSSIEFSGLTNAESRILMRKIKSDVGRIVTKENLDVAMQKLQATQAFESITYSLYGDQEPYRLVFDGVKGPVHRVGAGLRVDNQEWASILLNIGLNSNKLKGSKLDLESCINKNFYTTLHYSLDLPQVPTLNAEVRYFTNDLDYYSDDADIIFNTAFNGHKEAVYFSNIKWTAFDMKIGVQSTHFNTKKLMGNGFSMGGGGIRTEDAYLTGTVQSAFINSTIYTLDDPYYPTRGMNMNINAEWPMYYSCYSEGQDKGPIASIDYSQVHGHGKTVTLVTDLHARSIIGKTPAIHYANFIGGALAGRYWDQQIPFAGTNRVYAAERQIAAGNLELRISPFKNFYVSALGGAFITSDRILDIFDSDSSTWAYGFGGQLGYNTIIGPVRVRANWSNLFKEVEYYISLGFDF